MVATFIGTRLGPTPAQGSVAIPPPGGGSPASFAGLRRTTFVRRAGIGYPCLYPARMLRRALGVAAVLAVAMTTGGAQAALPSDPLASGWTYESVNLPAAWDLSTGSPSVSIAFLDSGVDASHPDLAGAVVPGYDFVDEDADPADIAGHGTAVAGVAAARANNGLGAAGACWECSIMPLRVLRPDNFALKNTMARALDYAVEHGAAVVNISLYGEDRNGNLHDAIHRARAAGVVVVAAAGNEVTTLPEYPAAYPDTISVGATIETGELADYSSRGDWVKVAAPACAPTTVLGGTFGTGCGTSGSTALVAGIAGLLRARAPYASVTQIERALEETAHPVADVRFGSVDAFAALQALGRPSPTLDAVIDGVPHIGRTLTAYSGVWSGAGVDLTYRWERCRAGVCEAVGHERTHVVEEADASSQLRVVLTSDLAGSATSEPTARILVLPRNDVRPTITGRPRLGATLTGNRGTWSGTELQFSYLWLRCRTAECWSGKPVSRARTYRVRAADRGWRLKLVVTAVNDLAEETAKSKLTGVVR
jgi:hypothetical protein